MKTGKFKTVLVTIVVTILTAAILGLMGIGVYSAVTREDDSENAFVREKVLFSGKNDASVTVKSSIKNWQYDIAEYDIADIDNVEVSFEVTQTFGAFKDNAEMLKEYDVAYPVLEFTLKRKMIYSDYLTKYKKALTQSDLDSLQDEEYLQEETILRTTDLFTEKYYNKPMSFSVKIPAEYFSDRCGSIDIDANYYAAWSQKDLDRIPEPGDEKLMKTIPFISGFDYVKNDNEIILFQRWVYLDRDVNAAIYFLFEGKDVFSDRVSLPFMFSNGYSKHFDKIAEFLKDNFPKEQVNEIGKAYIDFFFDNILPKYIYQYKNNIIDDYMANLKFNKITQEYKEKKDETESY